jgi:hypothetical protein
MSVDDRLRAGLSANASAFQPAVESGLDEVRGRGRRGRAARVAGAAGLVAAAAAVGVLVVTWSDSSDRPPPATPPTSPTAALFGRYESDVTRPARLSGHWVLEFAGNGTVRVIPPDGYSGVVSGTLFTADAARLRTNLFFQDVCADLGNGEFSWARPGARLVLADSNEPCAERGQFLTENTWIAVSEP